MNVCTFFVHRPEDWPEAADYPLFLQYVQRSCDRLGLRHVVLTDHRSVPLLPGIETFATDLPRSLMRAVTQAQAAWLEHGDWRGEDTLLTGADCLVMRDPREVFVGRWDMAVTLRPLHPRYPINTGTIVVRRKSRERVLPLFQRIAARCGDKWCDDQRAIQDELGPMPTQHGVFERAGLTVAFLPMRVHNDTPRDAEDRCERACVLHFRGKGRKAVMQPWVERWLK